MSTLCLDSKSACSVQVHDTTAGLPLLFFLRLLTQKRIYYLKMNVPLTRRATPVAYVKTNGIPSDNWAAGQLRSPISSSDRLAKTCLPYRMYITHLT